MAKKPRHREPEQGRHPLGNGNLDQAGGKKSVAESGNWAQYYLDIAEVMLLGLDRRGHVTFINNKGCRILEYQAAEIIGKNWFDHFLPPEERARVRKIFLRLMRGEIEAIEYLENPVLTGSGQERLIAWHNALLTDQEGEILGTLSSGHDVTEQRQKEIALKESQERFSKVFNVRNVPIAITAFEDGRFIDVNDGFLKLLGYTKQEVLGNTSLGLGIIDKDVRSGIVEQLRDTGTVEDMEVTLRTKSGEHCDVLASMDLVRLEGRAVILSIFFDITSRKRTEEALRESEERFRALFEGSLDAIIIAEPDSGIILDANPAAEELLGLSQENLIGLRHSKLFPPYLSDYSERLFNELVRDRIQGMPVETVVLRANGKEVPVEILGQMIQIDGVPVIHELFRNITRRKHAERDLKASEERYRNLVELSPDGIAVQRDGRIVFINSAALNMLGAASEDQVIGRSLLDFVPPHQHEMVKEQMAFLERQCGTIPLSEQQYVKLDGTVADTEVTSSPVIFEGLPAAQIFVRDITERKRAERALRASEERYRTLYQSLRDGCVATDMYGRVLESNNVFEEITGYTIEELRSLNYEATTPPKWRKIEAGIIREQVLTRGYSDVYEKEFLRKDGTLIPVEVQAYLIRGDNNRGVGFWAIVRDISRRKQLEAELVRMHTLESLGVLAAGIGHDFNNILTAILANVSMVKLSGKVTGETAQMLMDAERATVRARSLTHQLLTLAKGGEPIRRAFSFSSLLKETVEFALSGSNVRCEYSIPHDLWNIHGDEGQISQVVQNLVINAVQAMPEGGSLRISAENVRMTDREHILLRQGMYVKVSVVDEGCGIPEDMLSKVFDPFFTTKEKGRGLGLTICYSIVSRHDGHMGVHSEVGHGSTFTFYLPACEAGIVEKTARKKAVTRSGRILVIDDDELVLTSTTRVLKRLGYEVQSAQNDAAGIELFRSAGDRGSPFDAVVLDLTIPGGMGGKAAIRLIKDIDPGARVIVSSGYADDPVMSRFRDHGFAAIIKKPYKVEELDETLRKVLSGEDAG